jgi:hypothetical protein
MKFAIKIVSVAIILLGLIHTYFAFFCHYMDVDNLWFLGAGFAVIFAGLLNFVAINRGWAKFTLIIAFIGNAIMCAMFFYAIPILNDPQVYIGVTLFSIATILTLLHLLKHRVKSANNDAMQSNNTNQGDTLLVTKTIPMLRIFDKSKAIEFYVKWLGFSVDWEHSFSDGKPPIYMQISKSGIVIHLTEHHGDCTPGGKVFIECTGLRDYHRKILDKKYPYNAPGLETAPWKSLCMEVVDPFGNKLLFSEAQ